MVIVEDKLFFNIGRIGLVYYRDSSWALCSCMIMIGWRHLWRMCFLWCNFLFVIAS